MNNDVLKGKWRQLSGSVKEFFGKLTDDDLTTIEGSTDKFVGVLQERYGYSVDQAKTELDKFLGKLNREVEQTKSKLES